MFGHNSFYGYRIIAAAFVSQFVATGIFSYVLGPFMLPMIEELGWTRAEFTLSRSLGQLVMGLTGFVIGSYVDRFGPRPLMLTGTTVLVIALSLHSQITDIWQWLFLNGVMATIGGALLGNLVVNVTLAKWFVEKRGRAVAWAAMGVSFAGVVLTPASLPTCLYIVTFVNGSPRIPSWIAHDLRRMLFADSGDRNGVKPSSL